MRIDSAQRKSTVFPVPLSPLLLDDSGHLLKWPTHRSKTSLTGAQQYVVQQLLLGSPQLDRLSSASNGAAGKILTTFGCKLVSLSIPNPVDVILIDRGWGGVYQNTLDVWHALNKVCRALLISPVNPPYGYSRDLADLLIAPSTLELEGEALLPVMAIARSILRHIGYKLVVLTHRAVTPYFFDLVRPDSTIIHGDAYSEFSLAVGRHLSPGGPDREPWNILQELFIGTGEPWDSLPHAKAMYWTFTKATENWFWTSNQYAAGVAAVPEARGRCSVVHPWIDTDSIRPPAGRQRARKWILFTTTVDRERDFLAKGLDPLLRVHESLPQGLFIRVVGDLSDGVKARLSGLANVHIHGPATKTEMFELYQGAVANCRISLQDSTPISVFESMACETPVIVSPQIASNYGGFKHGENCLVVRPEESSALLGWLKKLSGDAGWARRIGEAGRRAVLPLSIERNLGRFVKYVTEPSPEVAVRK